MKIVYATLYYLESDNKILMLEKGIREDDPNSRLFTQPGGKIDEGETPLQAVCRESRQETGLDLIDAIQVGTVLFDNSERTFSDMPATKHFFVHVFKTTKYSGKLNQGTEEGKPVWIDKSKLENLVRHEGDILLDNFVKSGRNFAGVIYHVGTKLNLKKSSVSYLD